MDISNVSAQLAALPLLQYEFFSTKELTFSQRVRYVCEQECPMYGKSWACPPAVGSVEACRARCLQYPDGLMLATVQEVSSITDMAATLKTRAPHEALTRQAAEIIRREGCEVYVLSTEACAHCEHCTYPDAPCRFPSRMYPCVESHGIVVTALAEKYGIDFLAGETLVTWFSLILYRPADKTPPGSGSPSVC